MLDSFLTNQRNQPTVGVVTSYTRRQKWSNPLLQTNSTSLLKMLNNRDSCWGVAWKNKKMSSVKIYITKV